MHMDRYAILSLYDAHESLRTSRSRDSKIIRNPPYRPHKGISFASLLTHDLAGPKFMLIHVNMNRMTLVPWCITSFRGLRNLTGRYQSPEPSWSE